MIKLEKANLLVQEEHSSNNIAVIRKKNGDFRLCPVFDNGAALFSDTVNDYPLEHPLESCYEKIEAKPFDIDFDIQMDAAEELYGQQLRVSFTQKDVEECLETCRKYYETAAVERIEEVLRRQRRKYSYLFDSDV